MRGKSPRSDVEMTKKLSFVAAILDFWRAFLNQFWHNLVHTYKIHFWISFVLCVVFKCQCFWSYSRKKTVLPFIYIFQRAVTHSKCSIDQIFFYRFRTFQLSFFVIWVLSLSKNHEAKMAKNWTTTAPLLPWTCILCQYLSNNLVGLTCFDPAMSSVFIKTDDRCYKLLKTAIFGSGTLCWQPGWLMKL